MKEPPDWDRYSDREIQESIATNIFLAVGWLRQIFIVLVVLTGVVIGFGVRHFGGWSSFLGGWI